ncbi:SRPBCC domain-containing protein [Aerococcaceae bacterium NML191292]|nr:SRPBCC domain-containing protein [Aerococcaceae bacterium NML191292]
MTTEHKHDEYCCGNHHTSCEPVPHHHDCCGEHTTSSHCCKEEAAESGCCGNHHTSCEPGPHHHDCCGEHTTSSHCCKEEVAESGCCGNHHTSCGSGPHHHDCCGEHTTSSHCCKEEVAESGCCGEHHHHGGCCCGGHHSENYDVDPGLTVQFSGEFDAEIETVWQMLTDNAQIQRWFPELEIKTLEPGGTLHFNYQDGGNEEMMILDVEAPRYLSFTWDINIITFELVATEISKTLLVFTEWLSEVNDHSPKDLTGWMICLQNIAALIEGKELEDREEKFHELYPRIKEMLEQQTNMEFED